MYCAETTSYLGFNSIGALRNYLKQYSGTHSLQIPFNQIFRRIKNKPVNLCKIQNIEEPLYGNLNNSTAFVLSSGKDSITIASKRNIKLPYKYIPKQPVFAYGGVLRAKSNKTYWRYSIPRENAFKVNLCAIAYSVGMKPRNYMHCHKLLALDGNYLYLQIVEYSNRTVANKNIVSIHNSFNQAQSELQTVLQALTARGLLIDSSVYMESFEGEMLPSVEETPMLVAKTEDFL